MLMKYVISFLPYGGGLLQIGKKVFVTQLGLAKWD